MIYKTSKTYTNHSLKSPIFNVTTNRKQDKNKNRDWGMGFIDIMRSLYHLYILYIPLRVKFKFFSILDICKNLMG